MAVEIAGVPGTGPVQVAFATRSQMRRIKRRFWGIDADTDVVSFGYPDGNGGLSAEIILCPDVARDRAPDFGNSFFKELLLYAVHGILHICGEDDSDERESRKMRRRETQIMKAIESRLGAFEVHGDIQ